MNHLNLMFPKYLMFLKSEIILKNLQNLMNHLNLKFLKFHLFLKFVIILMNLQNLMNLMYR